jgi:hypothetical protein
VLIKLLGDYIYVYRLISAFSALVSVWIFYLLVKEMKMFKFSTALFSAVFFYAISPWLVFNARLGYEVTLAYLLFNIGAYFLWKALKNSNSLPWAIFFMSLATYTAHTQRFLAPIFIAFYLLIYRRQILRKENMRNLRLSLLLVIVLHIPHFTVMTTPAFWVKNERFLEQQPQNMISSLLGQIFSYLSPRNIFYELSDIDMQHTIPGLSVMYNFLVIPYTIGLYVLTKLRREMQYKFLWILFIASLVPAVLSGEFISIQRALPFLLPLSMVIGIGLEYIASEVKPALYVFLLIIFSSYALTSLYRSYFILFPKERAGAWNYGYSQLATFIKSSDYENYIIDNSRNPRNYISLLYFLDYPPSKYQKEVSGVYKKDYYRSLPPENEYKFSNFEVRPFNWESDSCREGILIGDDLSISEEQAHEHYLEKVYELKDPMGNVIFEGYKTNPLKKCGLGFL